MRNLLSEFRLYLCNRWVSSIPSHTFRLWFYRKVMGFNIGCESAVLMDCSFDCAKGFTIGRNSIINGRCRLDNRGELTIGNNVSVSSDVIILTADHDVNSPDFSGRNRQVVIDDYVWVGTRAMILPGVKIGKGAVIGAGSVVTKNVEPYNVVAGVPAKFIGTRNDDLKYTVSYRRLFQ